MLSKAQNKYIRSLTRQKIRGEEGVFTAEGDKIAREWLASAHEIRMITGLQDWLDANAALISRHSEATVHTVTQQELETISSLQAPHQVLLVVAKPVAWDTLPFDEWTIALDGIQDPGNMGTIIRIADWFGIKHVVCSPGCVDVYNPKVIQAAMGGHLRVQLYELDQVAFTGFIAESSMPVFAAALDGQNIYELPKYEKGILIIGNESKGISEDIMKLAGHKITIPKRGGAESLNAGVSAGILCALLVSC